MRYLLDILTSITALQAIEMLLYQLSVDPEGERLRCFHQQLVENTAITDAEMAVHLYGQTTTPNDTVYLKLKERYYYHLVNLLVYVETSQPEFLGRESVILSIQKEMAVAKMLVLESHTQALGVDMLEKIFYRAQEYDLIYESEEAARYLVNSFKGINKQPRKRTEFQEAYEKYRTAKQDYHYLFNLFNELMDLHRTLTTEELIITYQTHLPRVYASIEELDLVPTTYLGRMIVQSYHQLRQESQLVISNGEEALRKIRARNYHYPPFLISFHTGIAQAYVALGQFESALDHLTALRSLLDKGDNNYLKTLHFGVSVALLAGQYDQAMTFYQELDQRAPQRFFTPNTRIQQQIHRAYLQLLWEVGELTTTTNIRKYSVARFHKKLKSIAGDSPYLCIHRSILCFVFALLKGDYRQLTLDLPAFKQFIKSDLHKRTQKRTYLFCRLLVGVVESGFHAVKVSNDHKLLLKRFKGTTIEASTPAPAELVSYELLWDKILQSLKGYQYL